MNRMFKYRVKTLEEFQTEFGEDWRNVRASFVGDMDYLLGTDIDYECYKHVLDDNGFMISEIRFVVPKQILYGATNTWELSDDMVIRVDLTPQYKRRKFIYE